MEGICVTDMWTVIVYYNQLSPVLLISFMAPIGGILPNLWPAYFYLLVTCLFLSWEPDPRHENHVYVFKVF